MFACPQREENAQLSDQVRGDVVKELLPLVDNFELARTQVGCGAGACSLRGVCGSMHRAKVELLPLVDAVAPDAQGVGGMAGGRRVGLVELLHLRGLAQGCWALGTRLKDGVDCAVWPEFQEVHVRGARVG